jgi:hypothetical protein
MSASKPSKPDDTIVVVDDQGTIYKLDKDYWTKGQVIDNPAAAGIINELRQFGSVVAYVRPDFAVGFGTCCTVLNLGALKRE